MHGYTADPSQKWFPWITETLHRQNISVHIPAMPDPHHPDVAAWEAAAAEAIGQPDDNLVIVGHSLGCITTLRVLSALQKPWQLGGLIMVSGFDAPVPTLPTLDPFTTPAAVDYPQIRARTQFRSVLTSNTDSIVPPQASATLADHLGAVLQQVPNGGHFLDRQLPALLEHITAAFQQSTQPR
ncbi:RBBP9/YdeN family alpha/beta hydrolase [Curtobacterium sp. ME12]|uniref:RBBP9/YdeN family alpha/beta hydrolase n=1 Tax=Curtobacterium sp. ME12 TaxID=2744253 RepID=UPI002174F622|nr:alpha/beta hydrolase [Curtobacterium sp. ME12]